MYLPNAVKAIRVEALATLLATLPSEAILTPNAVGNLLVATLTPEGEYVSLGYIDLAGERFESFVVGPL